MSGGNKHYRVAKKEIENSTVNGIFIDEYYKNYIIAFSLFLIFISFISGMAFSCFTHQK